MDRTAALLVVDMQYLDAHADYGMGRRALDRGISLDYYLARLRTIIPNVRRLQDASRANGMQVIHTRIMSMTHDGRDRSPEHKALDIHAAPGSKEAAFLPEVAPVGDEIVFSKTAGGVFNSTNIHYVLRNLGVRTLIVCGVSTAGCVEGAVRAARDIGYDVIVIEDACGAWTKEMHDAAIHVMREVFAKIKSTDELIASLPRAAVVSAP
jgi:nicotinamidase-related amidase